jgi:hypothetical protein
MMSDPEVQKQATMTQPSTGVQGLYSYDPEFVDSVIEEVKKNRK